jgi:O-antigen ligase
MRFADGLAGAFIDNNGYALGTVMIMPLLLATAQNASMLYEGRLLPWIKRGLYLAVPLCVFTVFGTYSRGGFLALATALLVFVLLQRRRFTTLAVLLSFAALVLLVVPIPQSYIDRLQTIRTYNEIGEDSALSRLHFWKVAINMGLSRPFGVGVRQYEAAYDQFDFLHGYFGHHRAVHNSHLQVFSELGFFGTFIWFAMFGWAFVTCLRVRARSRDERLPPADRRLLFTSANALMVSMAGFLVGGAFISLALNDITWLTFGLVAALDKVAASDVVMSPHRPKPAVAGFGDRGAADMAVGFRVHGVPASARRVPRDSRV